MGTALPSNLMLVDDRPLYMSPSTQQCYETCPKQYYFRKVLRLEPAVESATLAYGKAVHAALEVFWIASVYRRFEDPAAAFASIWEQYTATTSLSYASGWDRDEMLKTGKLVLQLFVEKWRELRWTVLTDRAGKPLVERSFKIMHPNNVVANLVVDVIVGTPEGRNIVVDAKTPLQASPEGFADLSDQLTDYQIAAALHHDELPEIHGVAFLELLKRKVPTSRRGTGPIVLTPEIGGLRSPQELRDHLQKIQWLADDIRRGRFPKRSLSAHSSPCGMCDFKNACRAGDFNGLVERKKFRPLDDTAPKTSA